MKWPNTRSSTLQQSNTHITVCSPHLSRMNANSRNRVFFTAAQLKLYPISKLLNNWKRRLPTKTDRHDKSNMKKYVATDNTVTINRTSSLVVRLLTYQLTNQISCAKMKKLRSRSTPSNSKRKIPTHSVCMQYIYMYRLIVYMLCKSYIIHTYAC